MSAARAPVAAAPDFSSDDLAAYARGLDREIEIIRAANAASDTASTPDVRNALRRAKDEESTIAGGAGSSGLTAERYRAVREAVHMTFRTLDFQGKIDGPMSYDTSRATPEMRERLARDPYADLPAGSAAALRAREADLAPVWATYIRLTAVGG